MLPTQVTIAGSHVSAVSPAVYLSQVLPAGQQSLPYFDANDNQVEPPINFGVISQHSAALWSTGSGGCGQLLSQATALGAVINGKLHFTLSSASLNPPPGPVTYQLLGAGTNYAVVITNTANQAVSCGELKVGSPTRLTDGRGSEFSFRVIMRVQADGTTELLPYYKNSQNKGVSSANFSLRSALPATSGNYSNGSDQLAFNLAVAPNDPLNPFKHKYHPDHDNLDRGFLPMNFDTVNPNLWESYNVGRKLRFARVALLNEIPAFASRPAAEITQFETEVDWGGTTWGGLYHEVMTGVHKNDITIQGYFIIRHMLQENQLEVQAYDR